MSLSDELRETDKNFLKWTPLVPDQLEQHGVVTDDIEGRKDPVLERAFKALYDKEKLTKKTFSLLYAKPEQDTSEKDDYVAQELVEDEVGIEEDIVQATPDLLILKR